MTLERILGGVLLILLVVLAFVSGAWLKGCQAERELDDRPPAVVDSTDVVEDFDFGPTIPLQERPFRRNADLEAAGIAPGAAQADVDSFVAAAADSEAVPVFPAVRWRYQDERLSVRLPRSDGALVVREFECPGGCEGGAQDTTIFNHVDRAIPGLWPQVGRKVLKCGAAAAIGYGAGKLANWLDKPPDPTPENPDPRDEDIVDPWVPAGIAGGGCAILELAF